MSIERRRAMIVQAALPLLVEIGPNVTTLQIARAAGISEPAIYRAFADKKEVLTACLEEAMNPEHVINELEAIDSEDEIAERLSAIIEVIRAQGERTVAVLYAIRMAHSSKQRDHKSLPNEKWNRLKESRTSAYSRIHGAVCRVLETNEKDLRIPVMDAATLILAIVMSIRSSGWDVGHASVTTDKLVDLILHGIM